MIGSNQILGSIYACGTIFGIETISFYFLEPKS
jgi:hypothetical protein